MPPLEMTLATLPCCLSFGLLLATSCVAEPAAERTVPPDAVQDAERDLAPREAEPAGPNAAMQRGTPQPDEDTEHVVFDAGDASDVPAEGVVAQPQREPMPSLMGGVRYSPR